MTNISQLRKAASLQGPADYSIRIEGTVLWTQADGRRLVLADSSGAEACHLRLNGVPPRPADRILLSGHGTVVRRGADLQIGAVGAVIDNDGEHALIEKSGAVYLERGLNPIRLEWFNGVEAFGLSLDCEGPDWPRQRVPSSALVQPGTGTEKPQPGLAYQCYEGTWQALPQFDQLTPVQTGVVSNCDLTILPRTEHVAVVFRGQLDAPQSGLYVFHLRSDDGSRLYVGEPSLAVEVIGAGQVPEPRLLAIGQTWRYGPSGVWGVLEGRLTRVEQLAGRTVFELSTGPVSVRGEIGTASGQPSVSLLNQRIRVTGFCQPAITTEGDQVVGAILLPDLGSMERVAESAQESWLGADGIGPSGVPVLKTAAAVHQLRREEAERGYLVRLGGVVTSVLPEHQAFTLQDQTRGLYVEDMSPYRSRVPRVGEFLTVEGVTDPSLFAPIVRASRVQSLGIGQMPDPVKPTWDQLMNGSLDAQFVEIQGIVTVVQSDGVKLLTRDGVIDVELRVPGTGRDALRSFENALVRIRGCLFASWDYVTHQVRMGEVRIYDATLTVDHPPPKDLFSSPAKTIDELLQFDPMAGAFQRVKVSGQIVQVRGAEHFLMENNRGLRFLLMRSGQLKIGDQVDVVGFPELFGSASPVLREAVARRTGHGSLPQPKVLSSQNLVEALHDSTLVQVEGLLAGMRRTSSELILEIQSGVRSFVARVGSSDTSLDGLPSGTRLQLSGVYASHGGTRSGESEIAGFELLIHSPADVRVLAKPPWWTLKHLLVIVGLLACGLAVTMLWITQLRRQVEQRSAELAMQIKEREHVESQRALEQERARIAQDLHDELGSGITEISMLAARAKAPNTSEERRRHYLEDAWAKAREMVTALDEIVWAMDPHHDSLSSLVSYFSLYADRFLGLAGVAWRLEGPRGAADRVVDSHHRHQLFLVFKEALNNLVRHAGASAVRVQIEVNASEVCLEIKDNGRGMPAGDRIGARSGLVNMQTRVERLGGRFQVTSEQGKGTIVRMAVPSSGES